MKRFQFANRLILLLLLAASSAVAQEPAKKSIDPPQVYARTQLLLAEIDLVRLELGAPQDPHPDVVVQGVEPRENYFQAVTLYRKAERLCLEQTGDAAPLLPPAPAPDQLQPGDVFRAVDAALAQVQQVKSHLIIREQSTEPAPDDRRTPTDVFRLVVRANRQLNRLIEHEVTPTAVYQQLTLAVETAERLLQQFPQAANVPFPVLERRQRPADVHQRLVACVTPLRRVMSDSKLSMADVDWKLEAAQTSPADVYDAATLVLSELLYLESRLPGTQKTWSAPPLPPGRRLPAHNVQRARLLEAQLTELGRQIAANPNWLTNRRPSR